MPGQSSKQPVEGHVLLKIYNVLGQELAVLINKNLDAGIYNINLDAADLNSGIYFYTLESKGADGNKFTSTRKMLFIK